MERFLLFFSFCSLFCFFYGTENVFAQELTFVQKIEKTYNVFLENEKVGKVSKPLKLGWNSFKIWVSNLPGIRYYNTSVYSNKNRNVATNDMGGTYKLNLNKNDTNSTLSREDKKNRDSL